MKDMVCPKCGSPSIYRDDDYRYNMQVVACLMCGWRISRNKPRKSERDYMEEGKKRRNHKAASCGDNFKVGQKVRSSRSYT